MTKIIPAILETNVSTYRHKIAQIRQLTDRVQLDVIDGELIDNRTLQPKEIEPPSGLKLDIHLMVKHPLDYISQCVRLRPYTIIIQYEDAQGVVEALEKTVKQGLRAGLAINPDTTVAEITPLLGMVSHVLVMAYPAGFAGQKLQPSIYSKVAELRSIKDSLEIGLDGGVNQATLSKIKKAHFDVVNVNSYLFGAESILTRYHEIIEALS